MHAYIRTYIHTYMHANMHTYMHTQTHTHTHTHVCMHRCMHTHTHMVCTWPRESAAGYPCSPAQSPVAVPTPAPGRNGLTPHRQRPSTPTSAPGLDRLARGHSCTGTCTGSPSPGVLSAMVLTEYPGSTQPGALGGTHAVPPEHGRGSTSSSRASRSRASARSTPSGRLRARRPSSAYPGVSTPA
jgi:hypothetical protein